MRFACVVLGALVMAPSLFAQEPDPAVERAVDKALAFLAKMQEPDGPWIFDGTKHAGISGLASLAFLAAGHVPDEGPYGHVAKKSADWIVRRQAPNGLVADPSNVMYEQAIATLLLSQIAGMTDATSGKRAREGLAKATAVILRAQAKDGHGKGGWRYQVDSHDSDLSVTAWQILALRGARAAGVDVPHDTLERALKYVERCRDPSGGYGYVPGQAPTPACTASGLLILQLAGKDQHRSRDALQAGVSLLKAPPMPGEPYYLYGVYYSSHAMFQLGGNYWTAFRPKIYRTLLGRQQPNGAWISEEGHGPIYATSLAVLALTVERRLLPIYQRDEEPKGR